MRKPSSKPAIPDRRMSIRVYGPTQRVTGARKSTPRLPPPPSPPLPLLFRRQWSEQAFFSRVHSEETVRGSLRSPHAKSNSVRAWESKQRPPNLLHAQFTGFNWGLVGTGYGCGRRRLFMRCGANALGARVYPIVRTAHWFGYRLSTVRRTLAAPNANGPSFLSHRRLPPLKHKLDSLRLRTAARARPAHATRFISE